MSKEYPVVMHGCISTKAFYCECDRSIWVFLIAGILGNGAVLLIYAKQLRNFFLEIVLKYYCVFIRTAC